MAQRRLSYPSWVARELCRRQAVCSPGVYRTLPPAVCSRRHRTVTAKVMQSRTHTQDIPAISGAAKLASLLDFRPGSMVFVRRDQSGDVCREASERIPVMGAINDDAWGRGRRESRPERGFGRLRLFWRSARDTLTRVVSWTRRRKRRWQVGCGATSPFGNSAHWAPLHKIHSTPSTTWRVSRHSRPRRWPGVVSRRGFGNFPRRIGVFQTSRCACKFNSAQLLSSVRICEAGSEVLVTRDVIWTLLHLRQF